MRSTCHPELGDGARGLGLRSGEEGSSQEDKKSRCLPCPMDGLLIKFISDLNSHSGKDA